MGQPFQLSSFTSAGKWINYLAGKMVSTLEQNHVNNDFGS